MDDIVALVQAALASATEAEIPSDTPAHLHRERSRLWVEALAQQFRDHYANDPQVRVFSKHYGGNRADFLLNELLYDISVCRVDTVPSAVHKKDLLYIRHVFWQVESEFAKDSRKALVDFNKLVLGAARNKLFVGPQVHDNPSFMEVLRAAAASCSGRVFLALLPHPSGWRSDNAGEVRLWHFADGRWQEHRGDSS